MIVCKECSYGNDDDKTSCGWCWKTLQPAPMAPEIPLAGMADEFGFPKTTFEVEKMDFEEAKRLLKEFRDITSNRKSWLELQALLGRLP